MAPYTVFPILLKDNIETMDNIATTGRGASPLKRQHPHRDSPLVCGRYVAKVQLFLGKST